LAGRVANGTRFKFKLRLLKLLKGGRGFIKWNQESGADCELELDYSPSIDPTFQKLNAMPNAKCQMPIEN
jgi:hypothetical protein